MNVESNHEKRGIIAWLKSLDTASTILFVMIFFSQALYFLPVLMAKLFDDADPLKEEFLGGKLVPIVAVAMLIPMVFFTAKVLTVYDGIMEKNFFDAPSTIRIKERLSFLFRQKKIHIEFAATALVYLMFPLSWTNMALVNLSGYDDAGIAGRLMIKAVFLLAVLSLDIAAHLAAFNVWRRDRIEHPHKKRTEKEMDRQFMIGVLPWLFSGIIIEEMLPAAAPLFLFIAGVIFTPTALIIVAVAAAALFVIKTVRAVAKRGKFYGNLRSACEKNGFSISPVKDPVLSVFTMTNGESFSITAHGKTYSCKLIGAPSKNDPLAIYDNGTCTFIHPVRFLKVTWFHYVRSYAFGYEAGAETKVLIINPVAKELLTGRGGVNVPIDNGDTVGEYKIYAGTAFINALERGVIDK